MRTFDFFGQKDFYNFTLSGQPAAKVPMKTDTNISRKYYLARKIANQIYTSEVSTNKYMTYTTIKETFQLF